MVHLEFPGQDTFLLKKDGIPVYEEPMLKIGEIATCRVIKSTPYQLNLLITHVNNKKTSIEYKSVLRLQDYSACVENVYLDDFYKRGDIFDALIISFGDVCGCFVSTMSEGLGVVRDEI